MRPMQGPDASCFATRTDRPVAFARTLRNRFYLNAVLVSPLVGWTVGSHVMRDLVGIWG
jgi:hypothetical protein